VVVAVGHSVGEVAVAERELSPFDRERGEVRVRPPGVVLEAQRERAGEAVLELPSTRRRPGHDLGRPDVRERVDDGVLRSARLGEREGARAPVDGGGAVVCEHAQLRGVAVGPSELSAVR